MRKKKNNSEESKLLYELGLCLKSNDLKKALSLYQSSLSQNLHLTPQHFNSILHLCSSQDTLNSEDMPLALDHGFRVYDTMKARNIPLTEATITQIARLAAAKNDPDYGFALIKEMGGLGIEPKLRTYGPTLVCYCDNLRVSEAYEVEEHMIKSGVRLEEGEISALLRVSAKLGRGERVYEYLHKLRGVVRGVGEKAAEAVEGWFRSEAAEAVGKEAWDAGRVRKERERNGGGWHGLGWLGKGKWEVKRVKVKGDGGCCGCGERLVGVDIDCGETERFAQSVAGLALERESKSNFRSFMEWLEKHSDYEAVVDAANIGLYQQNFAAGGFSITQLEAVVGELYKRNGKWPLVVLHNKRLRTLLGNPSSRKLLDDWLAQGILYPTPSGSNDDWYWLYAAVKLKCLLVTNDEMRDHIFELLGSSFFLQWKERHQVHYTFAKTVPLLKMPPSYSILIQESETGSWHIPVASESNDELSRNWICITRLRSSENGVASVTGKRKERDPSPSRQL